MGQLLMFPGFFTGHDLSRGSSLEVFESSVGRVESGQEVFISDGSSWVAP